MSLPNPRAITGCKAPGASNLPCLGMPQGYSVLLPLSLLICFYTSVPSSPKVNTKVTLHDPCHFGKQHIGRRHDLYGETREVIQYLPGVDFVEMQNAGRWSACCGGGNSVTSTVTPEFTDYHSSKRCREAKEAADVLLTPCVRCVENLSRSARKHRIDIEVRSLIEFVAEMAE